MNRDDCTLSPGERARIKKEAERILQESGALGTFPTPVDRILAAAELTPEPKPAIDDGFLAWLYGKAQKTAGWAAEKAKRALDKVLGLFDARDGIVYIDQTVNKVKQSFIKLHEIAHAKLPWQKKMFLIVEDSEKTLAPDVADHFDKEANVFASDVLFQLDAFTERASSYPFGIDVPLKVGKKFGASAYASIRRYVSESDRACAVVVLEMPVQDPLFGLTAQVRRVIQSQEFDTIFGAYGWPEFLTAQDDLALLIPITGKRMSRPREITIQDRNGVGHTCIGEGFTQGFNVFLLLHQVAARTTTTVVF